MAGMQPEDLSDDHLEMVTGGSTAGIGGATGISMADLQSMDLETALTMVQGQRANLLEQQLKTQIDEVQKRNESIADMNGLLNGLNALNGKLPPNVSTSTRVTDGDGYLLQANGTRVPGMDSLVDMMKKSNGSSFVVPVGLPNNDNAMAEIFKKSGVTDMDYKDMTKGELDKAIQQVKSSIDAQSNSRQMDMLRLQSLSNKRNEAFDVMTNFVKKMQESRSSIIGNMR